nr:uncharacterized protein LOC125984881 isoform X3 [Syngnathus scovelli]
MKRRAGGRRPPDPRLVSGLQRKESPKESSRQVLKRSLMHEWPRLARGGDMAIQSASVVYTRIGFNLISLLFCLSAGSGWGDLMSACTERDWTGPRDQRWHEAEDESKRRIPAGGGANHRPTFARDERPTRGGRVRMRRGQSAQPAFKERLGVPIGCLTTKKAAAVQSRLLLSSPGCCCSQLNV